MSSDEQKSRDQVLAEVLARREAEAEERARNFERLAEARAELHRIAVRMRERERRSLFPLFPIFRRW